MSIIYLLIWTELEKICIKLQFTMKQHWTCNMLLYMYNNNNNKKYWFFIHLNILPPGNIAITLWPSQSVAIKNIWERRWKKSLIRVSVKLKTSKNRHVNSEWKVSHFWQGTTRREGILGCSQKLLLMDGAWACSFSHA